MFKQLCGVNMGKQVDKNRKTEQLSETKGELRIGHIGTGGRQEQVIASPQFKTVLCQQKNCQFAESCCFAHGQGELRTVQQNLAQMNPNYKGTLCNYYMTTGKCEFGSICQNAHGRGELEGIQDITAKLKTENLELSQDARAAETCRVELDGLRERAEKVDKLEAELLRYKDKMNDIEFFKSRV